MPVKDQMTGVRPVVILGTDGLPYDESNPLPVGDSSLDVALGNVTGQLAVNKYGYAPDAVDTAITGTDIWDNSKSQNVWTAPVDILGISIAAFHDIASTSAVDDEPLNVGAKTVEIYGLQTWDTKETSETVIMTGQVPKRTLNKYVIIHRMIVTSHGTASVNTGTITATAAAPAQSTITAQINPEEGQTQMAVYGIPSTQTAYLTNWYGSVQKGTGTAADVRFSLKTSTDVENSEALFLVKEVRGLQSTGNSSDTWNHNPYKKLPSPAIVKISAVASTNGIDCSAGFDLILVVN